MVDSVEIIDIAENFSNEPSNENILNKHIKICF